VLCDSSLFLVMLLDNQVPGRQCMPRAAWITAGQGALPHHIHSFQCSDKRKSGQYLLSMAMGVVTCIPQNPFHDLLNLEPCWLVLASTCVAYLDLLAIGVVYLWQTDPGM